MLINESNWIKTTLKDYFSESSFPLLNVGSSTKVFRENIQPHIDQNVFEPLRQRKVKVIHTDIKLDPGVDLVGDINDPVFQKTLKTKGIRSILCSNLLEHLSDPESICRSMLELVNSEDLLLITVPYSFPYHKDPIDTMLRPNIDQLSKMFPGTVIVTSAIVTEASSYRESLVFYKKYFWIMLIRWCMPFYNYQEWKLMINDLFHCNKKHSSSCILLKKL